MLQRVGRQDVDERIRSVIAALDVRHQAFLESRIYGFGAARGAPLVQLDQRHHQRETQREGQRQEQRDARHHQTGGGEGERVGYQNQRHGCAECDTQGNSDPLGNNLHSKARFKAAQVLVQLFARVHAALVS